MPPCNLPALVALTTADLRRLEVFHSQAFCKIQRIPSTYCTKPFTDKPQQVTVTNTGARSLAGPHSPSTLFGHVLRAAPNNLERNCCFTKLVLLLIGDGVSNREFDQAIEGCMGLSNGDLAPIFTGRDLPP